MAQHVKASNDTVVDLSRIASLHKGTNGTAGVLYLDIAGGDTVAVWASDEQYPAWLKWMEIQETMHSYLLRQIRNEAFDPFLDEMPGTLFSLFRSLPGSDKLTLTLGTDGGGHEDHMVSGEQLIWWDTFDEALEKMQAYKDQRLAPMQGLE